MNKTYGPALISCIKQNEKYHFKGLVRNYSENHHSHPADFQALARELSVPWHHIYYTVYITEKGDFEHVSLLRWLILHILYQSGSGHLRSDFTELEEALDSWLYLDREFFPGSDSEFNENNNRIQEIKRELLQSYRDLIEANQSLFGSTDSNTPFIYLKEREIIYIRKYYKMEKQLLCSLEFYIQSTGIIGSGDYSSQIRDVINEMNQSRPFPLSEETVLTTEKILKHKLTILSGGPGTGKTTTVTAILRILKIMEKRGFLPYAERIRLVAPTGRAANRMIESIRTEMKNNPVEEADFSLPEKAYTLHKLLGINPVRKDVLYNKDRPIPAELVILDEASMVDARMMSLLFDALSPSTRLLLVGDKDQLPSVDAGAVFGDIVTGSESGGHKLSSSVVLLKKSWRSTTDILNIAGSVINGEGEAALKSLKSENPNTIYGAIPPADKLVSRIMEKYQIEKMAPFRDPDSTSPDVLEKIFTVYEKFAVLIPTRRGPYGVERINSAINQIIAGRGKAIYHGQPIMIGTNDYNLSLFNGDRGIFLNFNSEYYAVFRDGPDKFRFIPAGKLSSYETAYAQTIHKSQGSEFNEILVLIPEGSERLLTREIVYTGITRAKEKLTLLSSDQIFIEAVSRKVVRHSGIREYLGDGNGN